MQTTETRIALAQLAVAAAATRTETALAVDRRPVAAVFITRPDMGGTLGQVEEDSADVYVSERCSPLNDY